MKTIPSILKPLYWLSIILFAQFNLSAQSRVAEVESLALKGGIDQAGGKLVITADIGGALDPDEEKALIYAVDTQSTVSASATEVQQATKLSVHLQHGELEAVELSFSGDLDIQSVTGANVASWSVRYLGVAEEAGAAHPSTRQLIIALEKPMEEGHLECVVHASSPLKELPAPRRPLFFSPVQQGFLTGGISIVGNEVFVQPESSAGLVRVETQQPNRYEYRFEGETQGLVVGLSYLRKPPLSVSDFDLKGVYREGRLLFTLTGVVESFYDHEHKLSLLGGDAALTAAPKVEGAHVSLDQGGYWLEIDTAGRYLIDLEFEALVKTQNGRSSMRFDCIDAPLQPVQLSGMPVAKNRIYLNGAPLELNGDALVGSLSGDGVLRVNWTDPSWKSPESANATLIYSTENLAQVAVGNGLVRQLNDIDVRIMQGAMKHLSFDLAGAGEVTRVESDAILSWKLIDEELRLELNKAYTTDFSIRVHSQYEMDAFPVEVEPLRVVPNDAIRHSGFIRIVNQGAVSIDVPESSGFAQVSPEYFPSVAMPLSGSGQVLAFRFSDVNYSYQVRAENILPEVAVNQILQYHIGQEDQSLTADMELTIREAPLRDFFIQIPKDYALSTVKVQNLADYFITEGDNGQRILRLVFSQPLSGRVLIKAEFENNRDLEGSEWVLPTFAAVDVKSVRGHIGVSADPGLRVSVSEIDGVSEQAANFFPKKVSQLQLALRMREPTWNAALAVEQLPQSIQADALHLYSVAEGRIYGSSVVNYLISGAPVSSYQIQVPAGVQNLDFAGRDVRGWADVGDGVYEVQLHSPASGAYTLLATYESQLESEGGLVDFSGVAPLGADAEQGYVVVVSNFPFALGEVAAGSGVMRLEPGEIPAEFRLLYDAQELAAFQYSSRPMQVALELRSLTPALGADQIIDLVELKSHISRDGEILTALDLMLKSKGQTHFRMELPAEHRIWSARVGGEKVSPISADGGILLPLPAGQEPNTAVRVQLELASQAADPERPVVMAPALFAPSLMVNWELTSDPGFGLRYSGGDISSRHVSRPTTGFAWFQSLLGGELGNQRMGFFIVVFLGVLSVVLARVLATRFSEWSLLVRLILISAIMGSLFGMAAFGLGIGGNAAQPQTLQDSLTLRTPLELSSQPLQLIVENRDYTKVKHSLGSLWPFIIGLGLWFVGFMRQEKRELFWIGGWVVNLLAALHYASSGALFLVILMLFFFVYMLRPFGVRYLQAIGAHALWVIAFVCLGVFGAQPLQATIVTSGETLNQSVVVEKGFATVAAQLTWNAKANEQVQFLSSPATLLSTSALPEGVRLIQTNSKQGMQFHLLADASGAYSLDFRYQVRVQRSEQGRSQLSLPVGHALSSRARVEILESNVELSSDVAVSIVQSAAVNKATVFDLVFKPTASPTIEWMPKQRDSSEEQAVYHVENFDVFTPLSGLVSGHHQFKVRLSQGQVDRFELDVPTRMTITSVVGPHLASWQFDPEAQKLICFFQSVQSTAFELNVFSQYAAGGLPYTLPVEGLQVVDAASQLSLVALATDDEVQIGTVEETGATTINLEDFPAANVQQLKHLGRVPTLRRAYRWSEEATISLEVLPVQPDIRVTTKQTVSLGEDRILLKADIAAQVNRAGVFKFSMPIPVDYDVESVSGAHLSHWNESLLDDGTRSLQLHLQGKTMGATQMNISLSGPGLGERVHYAPAILKLDDTARQSGTVALVPELGYRLNPVERKAALQLDPAEAGMSRQKLLLFRILNSQAALGFSVEQVEPWIEVEKLQRVAVRSGLAEVKTRFQFNVENAGIRSQRFQVAANAIGVQFTGEGIVDAQQASDGAWVVKLNRKMVGAFTVELSYQLPMPEQPDSVDVNAAIALDVDQQSGFLALVPQGRIQLNPVELNEGFQATEVPMVSAKLRGDLELETASHLYRLNQTGQSLQVVIQRHTVAELVPAQVRDVQLTSVISGQGAMLTKVRLMLNPGDKRMLRISLPAGSQFWFGFVNQQSVWPWREAGDVLLQLESNTIAGEDSVVEFFYASDSIAEASGKVNARLLGPKLDLPLENIKWSVHYPDTWEIHDWDGNLTREQGQVSQTGFSDLSSYIAFEKSNKLKQKEVAENFLSDANELLSAGKQQEARQAFSNAYNLSQFDAALNEDARVQLKNVREEQALVALANRRNSFLNNNTVNNAPADLQQAAVIDQGRLLNYSVQAKQAVLGSNSAEENQTLRLLAARLIDQQQAVPGNPQAIQTVIPQQGQVISFTRSLQINDQADLIIELEGKRSKPQGQAGFGIGMLLLLLAMVGGVSYVSKQS